jgi:hypothetical protein
LTFLTDSHSCGTNSSLTAISSRQFSVPVTMGGFSAVGVYGEGYCVSMGFSPHSSSLSHIYMKPGTFGSRMASAGKRMIRISISPANIDRSNQRQQSTPEAGDDVAERQGADGECSECGDSPAHLRRGPQQEQALNQGHGYSLRHRRMRPFQGAGQRLGGERAGSPPLAAESFDYDVEWGIDEVRRFESMRERIPLPRGMRA